MNESAQQREYEDMMDWQSMLSNHVAAQRGEEMKTSPQLTLGELILKLEGVAPTYTDHTGGESEKTIWFEFGSLHPVDLISWRGSYREIAITFSNRRVSERDAQAPTVREFLAMLTSAIGQTFTGYKGGDFLMGKTTPVWVANYGDSGNTGVVGVRDTKYQVYLETAWCDY